MEYLGLSGMPRACFMVYKTDEKQPQHIGQVYELSSTPEGVSIGDSVDSDIQVYGEINAPCKARVYLHADGCWYFENLSSYNNVFIDHFVSRGQKLKDGDRIQFSSVTFRFLDGIGEESQFHHHLHQLIGTDALTGISNKRQLEEHLLKSIAYCQRNDRPFCLVAIDIDNFRHINNEYGHAAGDQVLRELTYRIKTSIRTEDIFGRDGGEEFLIGLPSLQQEKALAFMERLRIQVTEVPISYKNLKIPVTFSAGLVEREIHQSFSVLKHQADMLMYKAKSLGKNRVCDG